MNDTINRYLAILCYPFTSLDFFLEDYFEEILMKKKEGSSWSEIVDKLQEATVHYVKRTCNVYSYDEVYMYLEKCYMYDLRTREYQRASRLYLECFRKIMNTMISQRDGKIVYKY